MRRLSRFQRWLSLTLAMIMIFGGCFSETGENATSGISFHSDWFSLDAPLEAAEEGENPEETGEEGAETEGTIHIRNPQIGLELLSGADSVTNENGGTDLVWKAENSAKGHEFIFRVNYSFSPDTSAMQEWEPGQIEIRIPKSILVDRTGASADEFSLSVPWEKADGLTSENAYVYKVDGDDIVIYNRLGVIPTQVGYIEMSYTTTEDTFQYVDYLHEDGGYESKPMSATLNIYGTKTVEENGETKVVADTDNKLLDPSLETEEIKVCIDTDAKITSTTKSNYGAMSWNTSEWGTAPEDSENYKYLMWRVNSTFEATQPFTYTLTDYFTPEQGELVGYVTQGESGLKTPENGIVTVEVPSLSSTRGTRTDYVVTRIQKEYYDKLLDEQGSFQITNEVTAAVTPKDGVDPTTEQSSSAPYSERVSTYQPPVGYFTSEKTGLTTNYDLTRLQQGTKSGGLDEISGLQYRVTLGGTTYKYTYDGDETERDTVEGKDNYGKKPVTFSMMDNNLWLEYDTESEGTTTSAKSGQLSKDDYRIDSLSFSFDVRKAEYSDEQKSFTSATMTEDDIMAAVSEGKLSNIVFTAYSGDTALGTITYNVSDGTYINTCPEGKIAGLSGTTIQFSSEANVTGFGAEYSSALYSSSLNITPSVTLKRNEDTVLKIINSLPANEFDMELWNRAQFKATQTDGESTTTLYTGTRDGRDYILGDTRSSNITKSYTARQNDSVRNRYLIVWQAEMEDYYTIRGVDHDVWQESGTFVDLLPEGFVYVPESLICYADDTMLQEGQYSVSLVSDGVEGQDRVLMTVELGVPAYRYRIVYTTAATWDTVVRLRQANDSGNSFSSHNAVAYITGNESIGTRTNDKNGTNDTDKKITEGLYSVSENKDKIISTGAYAPVTALVSSTSGLDKSVRATDLNSTYRKVTSVYADGEYSYRLHFGPGIGSRMDNLILFDFLEEFPGTEWYGIFSSVDTSAISAFGAKPVVYYCMLDRSHISNHEKEYASLEAQYDENLIWSATPPHDLSTITGIAVDMRKTVDEEDFIMESGQAASIIIYMHAPESIDVDQDGKAEYRDPAYNEVYLYQRLANNDENLESVSGQLISQGHTEVYYRISGDLTLKKVDEAGKPIQDIKFRLYGTSVYGTQVDMTLATRSNGTVVFENIEVGNYTLEEAESTPDYLPMSEALQVKINEFGKCSVTNDPLPENVKVNKDGNEIQYYSITDLPRVHGPLTFTKRGRIDGQDEIFNLLAGVTFRLSGVSDYGNLIDLYAETNSVGIISFPDVEMGTYDLTEINTAEHYVLLEKPITVTCDADGMLIMRGDNVEQDSDGNYTVYNEPLHTLGLMKVDGLNGSSLGEATFRLTGAANDGTIVNLTADSQTSGELRFTDLKAGTYLLQETKAPAKHLLSDTIYTVIVEENGKITLTWTDEEGESHTISNTKEIDGEEKIYTTGYGTGDEHPAASETAFDFVYSDFQIPNERSKDGIITITKVWKNDKDVQDTNTISYPVPIVHVDTSIPEAPKKKALMDRGLWITKIRDSSSFNQATEFGRYPSGDPDYPEPTETELNESWTLISYEVPGEYDGKIYAKMFGTKLLWWSDSAEVYLPSSVKGYYSTINGTPYEGTCNDFFRGFNRIQTIDLTDLKDDFVTNTESMFNRCTNLTTITFPTNFGSHSTTMKEMFNRCYSLSNANFSVLKTSSCTSFEDMFFMCRSLTRLDLRNFDVSKGKSFSGFLNMNMDDTSSNIQPQLTYLDISGWSFENATDMKNLINMCRSLTTLKMSSVSMGNNTNAISLYRAFRQLWALGGTLDLSWLAGAHITNIDSIFSADRNLTKIDLSGLDPTHLSVNGDAFENCTSLKTILVSEAWKDYGNGKTNNMFQNCTNIEVDETNVWDGPSAKHAIIGIGTDGTKGYFTLKTTGTTTEPTGSHLDLPFPRTARYIASLGPVRMIASGVSVTEQNGENGSTGGNSGTAGGEGTGTTGSGTENTGDTSEPPVTEVSMVTSGSPRTLAEGENISDVYDQWIVNSDGTWTYRFHVYDEELDYYITEENISGYTWIDPQVDGYYSIIDYTIPTTENPDPSANSVIITNKRVPSQSTPTPTAVPTATPTPKPTTTPTPPGSLEISKEITLAENVVLGQDEGKQFEFEITLDQNPGAVVSATRVTGTGTAETTSVPFPVAFRSKEVTDESDTRTIYVATVSLGDKESITLQGIPAGTNYTVTEKTQDSRFTTTVNSSATTGDTEEDGDDASGESGSVYTAVGDIISSQTSTAAYVNQKKENDPSGGFTLTKKLGETTVSNDKFTFVINLTGLLSNTTYKYQIKDANGQTTTRNFQSSGTGIANISLTLSEGETADFSSDITRLPVNARYTITELASGLIASYTISKTTTTTAGRIANSSSANSVNQKALATATETVDKDEKIQVVFTNTDPSYNIRFQKYGSKDGIMSALSGASFELYRLEGVKALSGTGEGSSSGEGGEDGSGSTGAADTTLPTVETYTTATRITSFTSTASAQSLSLKPGHYLIRETKVPDEYVAANPLRFDIDDTGYARYWSVMEDTLNTLTAADEDSWGGMASNTIMQMIDPYVTPAHVKIPISKTLNGRPMKEGEFTFQMIPISTDGEVDEDHAITIQNPASPNGQAVSFSFEQDLTLVDYKNAPYTDENGNKVFFYLIQEVEGNLQGVKYDSTQYVVRVAVTYTEYKLTPNALIYQYTGTGTLPNDEALPAEILNGTDFPKEDSETSGAAD